MPTYEYQCAKCGHTFEKVQSIAQPALQTCLREKCGMKKWGKGKVKRMISTGGGLIFKGSGFYTTDYRSEKYKEAAKKDAAPFNLKKTSDSSGSSTPAAPAPAAAPAQPSKPKTGE